MRWTGYHLDGNDHSGGQPTAEPRRNAVEIGPSRYVLPNASAATNQHVCPLSLSLPGHVRLHHCNESREKGNTHIGPRQIVTKEKGSGAPGPKKGSRISDSKSPCSSRAVTREGPAPVPVPVPAPPLCCSVRALSILALEARRPRSRTLVHEHDVQGDAGNASNTGTGCSGESRWRRGSGMGMGMGIWTPTALALAAVGLALIAWARDEMR